MSTLTPLMRQYLDIKKNYPDCVLFFRMGDFYEMFYDDARIAAKTLNIALTSRNKSSGDEEKVPLCGIPYHAVETYLARMITGGHKVAICEQVEDPKTAKGIVKRAVVRIVTPGTLTEDYLLDEKRPNLLAAVAHDKGVLGLATADLSTGLFTVREFTGEHAGDALLDEMTRNRPNETIIDEAARKGVPADLLAQGDFSYEAIDLLAFEPQEAERRLREHLGVATLEGFGLNGFTAGLRSAGAVIFYVARNSPDALAAIKTIRRIAPDDEMEIDAASIRNLEIVENLADGGREGTLIDVLDRTKTGMGARLLREWLVKPLRKKEPVLKRQKVVTAFFENPAQTADLRERLDEVGDFERAIGRIAGKSFYPRDFSSLLSSLKKLPGLKEVAQKLPGGATREIVAQWDDVAELTDLLERAVHPGHPVTFRDTGFIREGYHPELDDIRNGYKNARDAVKEIETKERATTGIPSLKIGYNKIYGYYLETTKKYVEKIPSHYTRKQSLTNCERYLSPELNEIEEKLATAEERAKLLETRLVEELRDETVAYLERVRTAAGLTALIDVTSSLAETARTNNYTAPRITEERVLKLTASRHPVIERLMTEENFVPNDIDMDESSHSLMVITGPNMAGKSTYLRQVALAVLMAQTGGYVAADDALIGLADRIFTRVGAQDRLQKGLSTFMVEMVETAGILNNATDRSVVILDEIGRGTSTFDGISIAWAVAEFLAKLKARTVFATHYHELTDLAATQNEVANFNVSAREYHDRLIFMRKVEPGAADKSYGIQVARLAGLPAHVLTRARGILRQLETMEFGADGKPALRAEEETDDPQISLFDLQSHPVLTSLKEADLEAMTPLEAMNFLNRLKGKL